MARKALTSLEFGHVCVRMGPNTSRHASVDDTPSAGVGWVARRQIARSGELFL